MVAVDMRIVKSRRFCRGAGLTRGGIATGPPGHVMTAARFHPRGPPQNSSPFSGKLQTQRQSHGTEPGERRRLARTLGHCHRSFPLPVRLGTSTSCQPWLTWRTRWIWMVQPPRTTSSFPRRGAKANEALPTCPWRRKTDCHGAHTLLFLVVEGSICRKRCGSG